jgi:hypothetical protein
MEGPTMISEQFKKPLKRLGMLIIAISALHLFGSCGEAQQSTPIANTANQNTELGTKKVQTDDASVILVAAPPPVQLFTYSKDKSETKEDKEHIARYERRLPDNVRPAKVEVDMKALFNLLRKGGVVEVSVKGEKPKQFTVKPQELDERGLVTIYLEDDDKNGLTSTISIGTNGVEGEMGFRLGAVDYEMERSSDPKIKFLAPMDPNKKPPMHPPVPHPLGDEINKKPVYEPPPPVKEKEAVRKAGPVALRVGVVRTALAALESGPNSSVTIKLVDGFNKLATALSKSSIPVTVSLVGVPETTGYSEIGKGMQSVLQELNTPSNLRADIASFRMRNEVDILIVLIGTARGVTEGYGGFAYIGGDASKSTIVLSVDELASLKIAHEIGRVLGADHHTKDKNPSIFNNEPNYGHVTPYRPEYESPTLLRATIMVDTTKLCSSTRLGAAIPYTCFSDTVFSDPTVVARTSYRQYFPQGASTSAVGCALQNPFSQIGSPCPTGSCRSVDACPYYLPGDYCTTGIGPPDEAEGKNLGGIPVQGPCYLKQIVVFPFEFSQMYGVLNKADVASLWKSGRPAAMANFRTALQPVLVQSIGRVVASINTSLFL